MALSGAQLVILKNNINAAEAGDVLIEQISFLTGGNVSKDSLTIVTVVEQDGKHWRLADSYDPDGHSFPILTAEVNY